VAQDPTSRRHFCRPDRAKLHAELPALTRIAGVWTLRAAIVDAGGEGSWVEFEKGLRDAQLELGEHTGVAAAIRFMTVLYTLHRTEHVGYLGLIGSAECISARVTEILGGVGGMSVRTLRGAARICEKADYIDCWVYGRGRLQEGPAEDGPLPKTADGKPRFKRLVSAYTLTVPARSFWSKPPRRRLSAGPVRVEPTSARLADNSLLGKELATLALPSGSARVTISSAPSTSEPWSEVSAVPADEFERAAAAAADTQGGRASAVPDRRHRWRPHPREPNDLGRARQALLYDLETVLLRHRRRDRLDILGLVEAELADRRFSAVVTARLTGVPPPARRSSGLERFFGQWLWHWRELPLETRQLVCTRMILPAALAHLRRVELWRAPPDLRAHISPGRCTERPPDPGPRLSARAPEPVARSPEPRSPPAPGPELGEMWCTGPPRSPAKRPAPELDDEWLKDLQRRRGGEEV